MAFGNGVLRELLPKDHHDEIRFGEAQNLLAYLSNLARAELISCVVFGKRKDGLQETITVGAFTGADIRDYVYQAYETFEAMAGAVARSPKP